MTQPSHYFYHDLPSTSERDHYTSLLRPQSALTFISPRGGNATGTATGAATGAATSNHADKPNSGSTDAVSTSKSLPSLWHHIPCAYIACRADRVIKLDEQLSGVEKAQADGSVARWVVREMEGGHLPMLTRGEELVGVLGDVVDGFGRG